MTKAQVSASYDFMTVAEAGKLLGYSNMTIYRMCKDGRIPAYKFGKIIRINRLELPIVDNAA